MHETGMHETEGPEEAQTQTIESKGADPETLGRCRAYVQRRIARLLPAMIDGLEMKAHKGDATAAKLLWQMAGLDGEAASEVKAETTLSCLLMERLNEYERQK